LGPVIGQTIDLQQINGYNKESYLFNNRELIQSALIHPARYWYENGISNHTQLLYGKFGQDVVHYHENLRLLFRLYCKHELGLFLTLESLVNYMKGGNFTDYFIEVVETEVSLQDCYRHFILKQDLLGEIAKNRMSWSFKKALAGQTTQWLDGSYTGTLNRYSKQIGLPEQ
jgi:hypothetical protein